jgi:PhnB protein
MDLIPDYVPSGYKTVNVFLEVNDAEKALKFYNNVFDADILTVLRNPEGTIRYAEFKVNDSIIMLAEDKNAHPGGVLIRLYVGDAEEVFDACVNNGCEVIEPLREQFYGDKAGRVKDPFGHQWMISRHLEDLSPTQLKERFNELY